MTKIEIVSSDCGDWEVLYINDKMVMEDHKIRAGGLLHCIKEIFPHTFAFSFVTDERAEEGFPERREELTDYIIG